MRDRGSVAPLPAVGATCCNRVRARLPRGWTDFRGRSAAQGTCPVATPAAPNLDDPNVIGNYRLGNCIATGQHSQVFEASEEIGNTGRRFAMKLLQENSKNDPVQVASLRHEFKVGSSLTHPNIIKYHEINVTKKHAFFVMEYFPVPNIKAQLNLDKGAMQIRCKRVIEQVALALDAVHKAAGSIAMTQADNILCSRSSEVRLIDFSLSCRPPTFLAKLLGKKPPIQGTRTYMAPEQILQNRYRSNRHLQSGDHAVRDSHRRTPLQKGPHRRTC